MALHHFYFIFLCIFPSGSCRFSRGHLALAVKCGGSIDLQVACMNISVYKRSSFELKQVLYLDGAYYFAVNICLLAGNIAFDHAICPDNHFSCAVNIAGKGAIYPEIGIGVNISLKSSACAYKAGTVAGCLARCISFGFTIEHNDRVLGF